MSNPRDAIRASLLGASPTFRSKIITDQAGNEFEVRQPSIKGRAIIRKQSTTVNPDGSINFEPFDFMLRAAIECTYVKGTDEKVFTPEDYDVMVSMPAGGLIDELSQAAAELCNVEGVTSKKPSEEAQSAS